VILRQLRLAAIVPLLPLAAGASEIAPAAMVEPPSLFGSFTFYLENDKFFAGTDQHYTQGLRATWLSHDLSNFDDPVRDPIATFIGQKFRPLIVRSFPDVSALRRGVSVGQNIYTPTDTRTDQLQVNDRPYAGWLYLGWTFHVLRDGNATKPARTSVFEVTTGVVGPGALGKFAQNGWHDLIGVDPAQGWKHQLRHEPGLNLVWERKLRYSTDDTFDTHGPEREGVAADFIPHYGLSLGNVSTYANAGAEVRAGLRLPRDFGTPVIRPSADTAIERELRSVGAHLFASKCIKRTERLIHQQHARVGGEGAGEADALFLASGQLPDAPFFEASEIDQCEHFTGALFAFVLAGTGQFKAEGDVGQHILPRQ